MLMSNPSWRKHLVVTVFRELRPENLHSKAYIRFHRCPAKLGGICLSDYKAIAKALSADRANQCCPLMVRTKSNRLWHRRAVDFRVQADGAKDENGLRSTGKLLLYPLVEDGRAEAPDLANLQGTNLPAPRHPLERLGMELQDRCRLVRVEQCLWEKCTWQ